MSITLSEAANYAQIASVPLTVLAWLVTARRFSQFWKTWGKLLVVSLLGAAFASLWRLGAIQPVLGFITAQVITSRWIYWGLVAYAFFMTVHVILRWLVQKFGPTYLNYREDKIFGVIWRWEYRNSQIYDPWCYCPSCDMVLVYHNERDFSPAFGGQICTTLTCENCGTVVGKLGGDKNYIIDRVKRHIDHVIRSKNRKQPIGES